MTSKIPLVIVADDDEDIREILKLILEAEGYRVKSAADGVEAWLQVVAREPPSLILLDLIMPRMDGECFMKILRAGPFAYVPAVILSGNKTDSEKIAELKADGFMKKPVGLDELMGIVHRFAPNSAAS